ncbi:MAG: hypothetical protein UX87_C0007G0012 [Candidatus Amesbacteria bacterium GW2011_GWA1_47_16]|uniref:DUF2079 domain membrane protein n=4 Tax=Candidatus Amesiibacteriota TaxID=1752730 RepID=A0A0G1S4F0_9BACT|nr:MAG: hypothetical protein UX86_C0010G0002 [Candidatus Amesbacteria bacterium GW2011_GWC1_47_15]KKU64504.1 MAG: hypothetical protein UX87_C0007G0012 [Candidatus Amesbacteria bacterium GW2011_GWA1_47_16]KKU97605.1 MAG: hypothetical protein UY28_C0017G0008 [Candidatus Amesbacteria bacterium GW2011_GWB1_48_13]OGD00389.1 MAG: hypothetical protein A2972_03930 [Candidatus Amesbacteria bacterium RIFCSPLOWO2_01_FULL_47_33]OGD00925.1 MAG: hypothetical protein A2701_04865 [Candidatus Amesbacteria bacte
MKQQILTAGFWLIAFLILPAVLYYSAFYSGSNAVKYAVNNHAELFYLLFIVSALLFSTIVNRSWLDKGHLSPNLKFYLLGMLKLLIVFYGVFLVLNTLARYASFRSEAIDVMFFKTEMWKLAHLQIPVYEWSQHFSPFLFLLAPFYRLSSTGGMLMLLQAAAVVSGAIPLYLTAVYRLKSQWLGSALAFSYLAFGGLQFGYAYGFHEIMFLPPLFFWTYYFYTSGKIKKYFLFLLLSLAVKEEVSLIVIFWGLYLLFKKNYRYAAGTIIAGILWYVLCFKIIFPFFNQDAGFGYWGQYPGGNGIAGLIRFAVLHPLEFFSTLTSPKYKLDTIVHSFGSFAFLSFLYPPSLIVAIPSLLEKLLSSDIAAKNGFHYSSAITAVILVSVMESLTAVLKKEQRLFFGLVIIYAAVSANILYGYHALSPLLFGREGGLNELQLHILNKTISSIPAQASVSAQYYIRPHISKPYWKTSDAISENETADYAIINLDLPQIMSEQETLQKNAKRLIEDDRYEIVVNSEGTVLFKRRDFVP